MCTWFQSPCNRRNDAIKILSAEPFEAPVTDLSTSQRFNSFKVTLSHIQNFVVSDIASRVELLFN